MYDALESKVRTPDITYQDLFNGIQDIHPSYRKKLLCWGLPGIGIFLGSLLGIICFDKASNWYVLSLVSSVGCVIYECILACRFGYKWHTLWIVGIGVLLIYISKVRDLDENIFVKFIDYFRQLL